MPDRQLSADAHRKRTFSSARLRSRRSPKAPRCLEEVLRALADGSDHVHLIGRERGAVRPAASRALKGPKKVITDAFFKTLGLERHAEKSEGGPEEPNPEARQAFSQHLR